MNMTMAPAVVFYALAATWIFSELLIGRRRAADKGKAHDRGTLKLLHLAIYASVGVGVWMAVRGISPFPQALRGPLSWTGCTMMALGIAFRWWAVRVLAEHFTVDVDIRPGHRLVRRGPYRWLRHPSYTGALLTFHGFALALGSVVALLLIVVVVTGAFLWRIHVEEGALKAAFGPAYDDYARETWRLLPWVW